MVKLTQEIPARLRVRGQMDETGALSLIVQVSAPYGVSVDKDALPPECSVRFDDKLQPELVGELKTVLDKIRVYTLEHCAPHLQRAIVISAARALELGEIKES